MQPVDAAGRPVTPDLGRESVSQPVPENDLGTADDRHPDEWQPLGYVLKRVIARLDNQRR